ncbi:JAB domain-containing protein [Arenimonas sp. MALMAid1274]|uniref:JAB domain-containing protein n=1 Tax=Arenimonas sp. MALMAid1274 TaxID=3411630 RepID=UPI003BA0C8AA
MPRTRKASAYTLAPEEQAILEAAEKILQRRLKRHGEIRDPGACADYLKARCAHLDHEVFGVVYLDTRHRILDHFVVSGAGTTSFAQRGLL